VVNPEGINLVLDSDGGRGNVSFVKQWTVTQPYMENSPQIKYHIKAIRIMEVYKDSQSVCLPVYSQST
ncbi:hypothetical protein KJ980_00995, partial [Patescibacteria group bacterium]|nr:hypothetical protein [Patescibacteria group bacterium]MBU4098206.1 hypothetical protein [Patescibacteria group bacterium]